MITRNRRRSSQSQKESKVPKQHKIKEKKNVETSGKHKNCKDDENQSNHMVLRSRNKPRKVWTDFDDEYGEEEKPQRKAPTKEEVALTTTRNFKQAKERKPKSSTNPLTQTTPVVENDVLSIKRTRLNSDNEVSRKSARFPGRKKSSPSTATEKGNIDFDDDEAAASLMGLANIVLMTAHRDQIKNPVLASPKEAPSGTTVCTTKVVEGTYEKEVPLEETEEEIFGNKDGSEVDDGPGGKDVPVVSGNLGGKEVIGVGSGFGKQSNCRGANLKEELSMVYDTQSLTPLQSTLAVSPPCLSPTQLLVPPVLLFTSGSTTSQSATGTECLAQTKSNSQSLDLVFNEKKRSFKWCSTHVAIAYYIFYHQRYQQIQRSSGTTHAMQYLVSFGLDPTYEARLLKSKTESHQGTPNFGSRFPNTEQVLPKQYLSKLPPLQTDPSKPRHSWTNWSQSCSPVASNIISPVQQGSYLVGNSTSASGSNNTSGPHFKNGSVGTMVSPYGYGVRPGLRGDLTGTLPPIQYISGPPQIPGASSQMSGTTQFQRHGPFGANVNFPPSKSNRKVETLHDPLERTVNLFPKIIARTEDIRLNTTVNPNLVSTHEIKTAPISSSQSQLPVDQKEHSVSDSGKMEISTKPTPPPPVVIGTEKWKNPPKYLFGNRKRKLAEREGGENVEEEEDIHNGNGVSEKSEDSGDRKEDRKDDVDGDDPSEERQSGNSVEGNSGDVDSTPGVTLMPMEGRGEPPSAILVKKEKPGEVGLREAGKLHIQALAANKEEEERFEEEVSLLEKTRMPKKDTELLYGFYGLPPALSGLPPSLSSSLSGLPSSMTGLPHSLSGLPSSMTGLPHSLSGLPNTISMSISAPMGYGPPCITINTMNTIINNLNEGIESHSYQH